MNDRWLDKFMRENDRTIDREDPMYRPQKRSAPKHNKAVDRILDSASRYAGCQSYSVYNNFRHQLEALNLTNSEYQKAIIKLASILSV